MRNFQCLSVLLRLVLVSAIGLILSSQPAAAQPGPPIIRSIVPENGAAGFGQLITIQGSDVFVLGSTTVTFTPKGGAPSSCVFVFPSPSNSNEFYVRLGVFSAEVPPPPGCTIPSEIEPGKYKVTVTTSTGVSNKFGFQVNEKPGTPIPRKLIGFVAGLPTITSAKVGSQIGIVAYGTEGLVRAVFSQGSNQFLAVSLGAISGPNLGLASKITVPLGLSPGPTLVQVRTRVNGVKSDLSFALKLTIVP